MFKRYACVKQSDFTDCGPACLATILKQFGLKYPVSKIRVLAGTDKNGTNLKGMILAGEQLGLSIKAVKGDKTAFYSGFPLPAIAHTLIDNANLHYIVIWEIQDKHVIVADPGRGIRKLTHNEFFKIWTGRLLLVSKNNNFATGDQRKNVFSIAKKLLIKEKKTFGKILLFSILISISGVAGTLYYKYLIDDVAIANRNSNLTWISLGVISIYVFQQLFSYVREKTVVLLERDVEEKILMNFYHKLFRLPLNFFTTRQRGDIISRLNDVSRIRDAISNAAVSVMIDIIMVIIAAVVLIYINPALFMASLVMVLFFILIMFFFMKPTNKMNLDVAEANAIFCSYMIESVDGVETVKSYCYEKNVGQESQSKLNKLWNKLYKLNKLSIQENMLATGIKLIGETLILWYSATKMLAGQITVGDLILYNVLLNYFITPISRLINLQPTIQTAFVAARRIIDVYELSDEQDNLTTLPSKEVHLNTPIDIKDLSFRYGSRALVLDNISILIKPGQKIAFVGESGCGKTTLAKLLLNFYQAESGSIYYGDTNISDIPVSDLRNKIAYVSQDTFLFRETIRNNLTMGNTDISDEEIYRICDCCRLTDFINKQPAGLDTIINELGSNLSGGQKQRIAIARALLKKPEVLILDEATSNLDSITEKAIVQAIDALGSNVTVIIIAHRLSTIKRCDNIFVFSNKGKITENGSYEELINKKGFFYELWNCQNKS